MKYLHLRSHSPLTRCTFLAAMVFTTTASADVRTNAAAAFNALEHTLEKHNPNSPDETRPRATRSTKQSRPATRAKTRHHTAHPLSTRTHQRNSPPLTSLSSRRQPAAPNEEYSGAQTPAPVHSPRATSQPKMNTPPPPRWSRFTAPSQGCFCRDESLKKIQRSVSSDPCPTPHASRSISLRQDG